MLATFADPKTDLVFKRIFGSEARRSLLIAAGKRDALLRLLAKRGLGPTDEEHKRTVARRDAATLDRWFDAALVAGTVAEVLGASA